MLVGDRPGQTVEALEECPTSVESHGFNAMGIFFHVLKMNQSFILWIGWYNNLAPPPITSISEGTYTGYLYHVSLMKIMNIVIPRLR